ncbi:MAG: thioredoxin domain-containing protein [Leptospiraceae bacterium]|nr:MAG: thioredoxin domain-containing protein [Leptospiraceae bacterium]
MQRKPNRLIHETSPYLLQHAYNPVDWYPWGKEAFEKAKRENKLIFLSIGYSTCHWCHVMEKESFEKEDIANILNEFFVPIKVDREELPDVDHIYMKAIQLMGMQGGWPLNIFLTPDLKPITGGTYFPPERKWGLPSFKEILLKMIHLWNKEKDNIIKLSEEITQYLNQPLQKQSISINYNDFISIIDYFEKYFDKQYGGYLINGKNKFPPSLNLFLLLQLYKKTKNNKALQMIELTLKRMRFGGIYDQIGGGIHRYSTDHYWLIPHFEKMLYDNALFSWINLETYKITKNPFYLNTAIDVLNYLFRDMKNPQGGFFSAEDADSEGEEGKFYTWTKEEFIKYLENHLTKEELHLLIKYFGLSDAGNFEGKNVLFVDFDNSVQINENLLNKTKKILLEYRNKRIRPHRDEKILTSWNALMISTLSYAYLITLNPIYLKEAKETLNFILEYLSSTNDFNKIPEHCIFYRSYSNHQKKRAPYTGTLTDHASMGCAFIDLYKATGNIDYLMWAQTIKNYILRYYYDSGILYEVKENENELIARISDFYDGVIPSGLSFTIRLLVHLYYYGIDMEQCETTINKILEIYFQETIKQPFSYSYFLMSVFKFYFMNQQIVLSLENQNLLNDLLQSIGKSISSETIIGYNTPELQNNSILLLKDKMQNKNFPYSIYLCENFTCYKPINDINQLDLEKIF